MKLSTNDRRSKVDVYELSLLAPQMIRLQMIQRRALATAAAADADAKAAVRCYCKGRNCSCLVAANEKAAQVDATQAEKDAAVTAAAAVTTAEEALQLPRLR